jgi:hypothetical protein
MYDKLQDMVHDAQSKQDRQFSRLIERLDTIIKLLQTTIQKENTLMATIQDLATEVASETTIDNSIVTLLDGIAAQLAAAQASGDPAAIQTVLTSLQSNAAILTAAITANTPVVVVPTGTTTVPTGTPITTAPSTGAPTGAVSAVAK